MSDEITDQILLDAWKRGDQTSADLLFQRYHTRLMALVRSRLSRKLARRIDPEDIVLSAYRSFFITARKSDRPMPFTETLWQLLTTIALRKLSHQARRHLAQRRSVESEQHEELLSLQSALVQQPTAEHAAILVDQLEQVLNQLDSTARETLVLTLQGHDPATIAERLNIHERSVRKALERIRNKFPAEKVNVSLSTIFSHHRETFAQRTERTLDAGTTQYEQYVLQKLVGAGAFSKVYRAVERSTGTTVAIKYLRKDCWYDPRASASLRREYTLLKQLNHPQILSIRGWGTTRRGALFLVSELIEGTNLETWSKTDYKTSRQIISIVRQVAEGVRAAHAIGILHGDIKPANVLMGKDGRVVLCDFGFARYASAPDEVPRGGTAGFLAPEQICDQFGPITEQTDVYGLGGLLYSLLTGRPPILGRDLPETMAFILSSYVPAKPSKISSNSFNALDNLVLRCLAKEPPQRPADAEAVINMLADLESGSPSHANF